MINIFARNRRFWMTSGIACLLLILWSAPLGYRIDIGHWDNISVQNFHAQEFGAGTWFRWSKATSLVTLAGVGAGDYWLEIQATAPVGTSATITIDDAPAYHMTLQTVGFVPYRSPTMIHVPMRVNGNQLTIHVLNPSIQAQRELGIAVDDVRLIPVQWHWPDWWALFVSGAFIGVALVWGRWWRIPAWLSVGLAIGVCGAVVFLRRGDAVYLLWQATLMLGASWAIVIDLVRQRRWQSWVAIGTVVVMLVMLYMSGSVVWQPLWQLDIMVLVLAGLAKRRVWWRWIRPWRWWLLGGLMSALACTGILGMAMTVIALLAIWRGRRLLPDTNRYDAVLRALYSIATVLDAWLTGTHAQIPASSAPRRVGLDVIRAFAIMSVLLGHASALYPYYPPALAWLPHWFAYVGVECFFVLSGWLIGGLLIRHLDAWQSPRALAIFLHRRWVRTLPTYWIVLGLVGVVGWGGATLGDFVPYLIFSQNIWQAHPPFLFVAWSLSIEEWFYLFTAVALSGLASWWRPATALRIILVVLITVPLLLRSWMALSDVPWEAGVRQLVPLRLDALAMGVVMVWWWYARPRAVWWLPWGAVMGSIAVVVLFATTYTLLDTPTWWRVLLLPLTTLTVACWLPWLAQLEWPRWPRMTAVIQWLALISYPLYLLHTPWRLTVEGLFGGQGASWWRDGVITSVYLLGSLWLAYRCHLLIERPLMQLRWRDDN